MATWISIALVAWVALSVVVSIVVGGMIRLADVRRPSGPSLRDAQVHRMRRWSEQPLRRVS